MMCNTKPIGKVFKESINKVFKSSETITSFIFTVKTDNVGTSNDDQFKLPLRSGLTYNCQINWGDTTSSMQTTDVSPTHTYPSAGTYTITISGTFPSIYFNNGGDKAKLTTITNFGAVGWNSFLSSFYGCSNLVSVSNTYVDSSSVVSMTNMFYECSSLTALDFSGFDTSNVTDMANTFFNCSSLTTLDVSGFDTAKVTNMRYMFYNCSSLTALDVSGFDTAKVTNMQLMFYNCSSLTALDVSGFDTAEVINMEQMFRLCSSITTADVSGFDTSKVTTFISMFNTCTLLTTADVSGFDTSSVITTGFAFMFNGCINLVIADVTGFDVSKATNIKNMFAGVTSFDQNIGSWVITSVTDMTDMFSGVTISTSNYNGILTGWEAQAVQNNVVFHGGNSEYSAGAPATARAALIADHTWTITDGGLE